MQVTTRGPQTAADWTAQNPVLDQFEIGIEVNPATGAYEKAKIGDGRTAWTSLGYWNPSGSTGSGGALTAVLQADFAKTNDTLANVTDLTLNLEAGKWYWVTGQLQWDGGDGVGGKLDFAGGTATATGLNGGGTFADGSPAITGAAVYQFGITALTDLFDNGGVFGRNISFSFTIQVNVGGTLIPRFAQAVTDVAASTLLKYSTIQALDVTP